MDSLDLSADRALYYLRCWVRWMHTSGFPELGYPKRAMPFIGGGETQRFEDWHEAENEKFETHAAEVVDALIRDLEAEHPSQACAIYHFLLGAPWRFPRGNAESLYQEALEWMAVGVNRKGLP